MRKWLLWLVNHHYSEQARDGSITLFAVPMSNVCCFDAEADDAGGFA